MYKRKTRDEWEVQGLYNGEWECVTTEDTLKGAKDMLKCYNENETRYPHRIHKVRVRIQEG